MPIAAAAHLLASTLDPPVEYGAGAMLVVLFGLFVRGMNRNDDGTWKIIAEKDKQIADRDRQIVDLRAEARRDVAEKVQLRVERDFWKGKVLADEDIAELELARHLAEQDEHDPRGEAGPEGEGSTDAGMAGRRLAEEPRRRRPGRPKRDRDGDGAG